MSNGRLGFAATTVSRKSLRKKRELTDAQLLASARRAAEKWQASKNR